MLRIERCVVGENARAREQDREIDCSKVLDCGRQDRTNSMSVLVC